MKSLGGSRTGHLAYSFVDRKRSFVSSTPYLCTLRSVWNCWGWSLIITKSPSSNSMRRRSLGLVSAHFFIFRAALSRQARVMSASSCHGTRKPVSRWALSSVGRVRVESLSDSLAAVPSQWLCERTLASRLAALEIGYCDLTLS